MTTPRDIITMALKDAGVVGVGQTPLAEDMSEAFTRLNWMLATWNASRWMVFQLVTTSINVTGAQSYSVGPGGDFDIPTRPDVLEFAFVRQDFNQSQGPAADYPLEVIGSMQDYNRITLKDLTGAVPNAIYYDPGFPLGRVYPFPVPQQSQFQLHLTFRAHLNKFANESDDVELPDQYVSAIHYNLAMRLRAAYGLPPDQTVVDLAKGALSVVKNANTQIPKMTMPSVLGRRGRYNVYADTGR